MPIDEELLLTFSLTLLAAALALALFIVVHKVIARRREVLRTEGLYDLDDLYQDPRRFMAAASRSRATAELLLLTKIQQGDERALSFLERLGFLDAYRRGVRSLWASRRAESAHNLGLMPLTSQHETLLIRLVNDRHTVVQEAAVRALSLAGSGRAVAAILHSLERRSDPYLLRVARHALGGCSEEVVTPLLAATGSPRPQVRRLSLEALAECRSPRILQRVLPLVGDPDLEIRLRVARALRHYDRADVVDALVLLSRDDAWQVRAQAARALSWVGGDIVVPRLAELAHDPSYWVRNNASQSLRFKGAAGKAALKTLAAGSDVYAAERARESLDMMQMEEERAWNTCAAPS